MNERGLFIWLHLATSIRWDHDEIINVRVNVKLFLTKFTIPKMSLSLNDNMLLLLSLYIQI